MRVSCSLYLYLYHILEMSENRQYSNPVSEYIMIKVNATAKTSYDSILWGTFGEHSKNKYIDFIVCLVIILV